MSDPPPIIEPRLQIIINNDSLHHTELLEALTGETGIKPVLSAIATKLDTLLDQGTSQITAIDNVASAVGALEGILQPLLDTTNAAYNKQLITAEKISDIELWSQITALGVGNGESVDDPTLLGRSYQILLKLAEMQQVLGTLPIPGEASILSHIYKLSSCSCKVPGPPSGDCTDPFASTGIVESTKINEEWVLNGVIATWNTPYPDGIGAPVETDDTIPYQEKAVLISSVWEAFYVYVTSTAEYFHIDATTDRVYKTNEWVLMPHLPTDKFFWVELGHELEVTICRDNAYIPDDEEPITGSVTVEVPAAPSYTITRVVNVGGEPYSVKHLWEVLGGSHLFVYHDLPLGASTVGVSYDAALTQSVTYYEHAGGHTTVGLAGTNTLATTARVSVPPEE